MSSTNQGLPVFILGLDAADHLLIEQWAAEGKLPAIARLLEAGAYGILASTASVFSGSAWVSITTGCNPAKCGVYSRYQLAKGTYDVRRIKANDSRVSPFWTGLTGPMVIADVPKAPLTSSLDGVQLVEWGTYDHYSDFSSIPSDLSGRILDEFGGHPFLERDFEVALHGRRDFEVLKDLLLNGIKIKQRLNLHLLRTLQPRLFFSVFGETHAAGHAFWRFQEPRHPFYQSNGPLQTALAGVYGAMDAAIGEFVDALPPRSTFVLLSSQGFAMDSMASEDFLSEVLIKSSLSIPRLTKTQYAPYAPAMILDMTRSRAFCLPGDLQGYVRINLRGREPTGVVAEDEYEAVCQEIETELMALRHRDTEAPVVSKVIRIRDLFKGDFATALPDLSVIWNTEQIVTEVESPRCGLIQRHPDLSSGGGNHRGEGFMIVTGPNVRKGRFAGHVFDVAPTICSLLGDQACADSDGRVLAIEEAGLRDGRSSTDFSARLK
jgi:predicted AlkP superfamily phosphohydrolase/phosphomutase